MVTHFPLKVLFVTGALSFGGLERVVINLCQRLNPAYYKPIVVCLKSRGELADELEDQGIKVISLNANKHRLLKYFTWLQLAKIIRSERPHIIHSHNTASFLDAALARCLSPCAGFVHTDHTRSFPDQWHYMAAEYLASHLVYRIVAVSEETKQNLIKYERIHPDKISVINNGIEKEKFDLTIDEEEQKRTLGVEKFDFIVGAVVVLRKQKGISYLIKAAVKVLKKYPKTGFLIAGDGPLRKELHDLCAEVGISENFLFLGARKDIPELLQLFDIYVLPSLWEGLPLSVLEAMAARRCILSTQVGGVPLAIRDGAEGVLVPPKDENALADQIINLRENQSFRFKLAAAAHIRFLETFTVDSMTNCYEQLYLEAYENSKT